MNFHYPNGSSFKNTNKSKQLNLSKNSSINYGDRGMSLEAELNQSNEYYLDEDIAVVHKKPTPIQIVNVDYPKRSAAVIKEAYFQHASTTDYNGVYRGKYIDFDAKETTSNTSFPLSNFHEHQIEHMRKCTQLGGITFAMIKFVKSNELFVLAGPNLFYYWDRQNNGGRKSISKTELQDNAYQIKYHFQPLIPYLSAVDHIIDDRNNI
ncbi:Holliday junction resolvase RecU [Fructilactobacillus fructivorans]|uniref:Holliday junction resolvase RecU n=1 Tax=Fructilactobacillus fructivorans TaxID=1614 RepID=A0AAE6P0F4_9LACO|nr:Holliday junction resolvase RecU [Fructilactobacillus fructivorans]KRK58629.1 Holliday junction-specific endonuclease [Fructilactobacillus fructivorans]KRN40182.1 Holliday junction-specific endonuclease [Fructilactobacillus fructivorans]KRN43485.1 Holliday junction-specific endonuclease [Fructilactobacillus fructivorans]QFX92634.1 Holliday junction resolvase RecU [Fructilactobacillus fructivorans]RDV65772.1 Holliday junction resolvase RecU [Fructilactobacillus fructivorans]